MALPSSGQIAFSDVRTETSQSAFINYAFRSWVQGKNAASAGTYWLTGSYSPINILSSGSRFSSTSIISAPFSFDAWHGYNHTANISSSVTGTLYNHWDEIEGYYASMILVNAGTSNTTWSINISGSTSGYGDKVYVYYGRPWTNSGAAGTGSATFITGGLTNPNMSFNYNYTYDSGKGQYLYFVLLGATP